MDLRLFANPPKPYRPAPFWAWNDDLAEAELRWQVREMKEKGFGGYFMHSRAGLITEYLSEDWMKAIAVTVDEGKKQDMESWLYDEDRWPSGFAGGLVPAMNPEYVIQCLMCEEVGKESSSDWPLERVAVFAIERDEQGKLMQATPVSADAAPPRASGTLVSFHVRRGPRSGGYNGEAYVDLLSPEVTRAFLRSTHEAYAQRFGADYGPFLPGIFTDEPNYSGGRGVPWTRALPRCFLEQNGYDLLPKLPLLFFDGPGAARVRYDFWRTCTRLFVESFSKLLFEHCERHGVALTGHYLAEDTLLSQLEYVGAAMPHYEYMQLPGIDHLGRNIKEPLTLKQVSSAAHQFGQRRILCEIFGVSGHSMSFEDQKWIADFHFALGITFMNPHLMLYSMKGERKRDYPPTLSYHQPYWPSYRLMNDYLARCSYAMSQGRHVADILLLHPIASAWTSYRAPINNTRQPNPEVEKYDREFAALVRNLLSIQRDFDLGDEMLLERHGRVEGCEFVVGQMRYPIVILPPGLNWSANTISLLAKFAEGGGYVVAVGEMPSLIGGQPGHELRRLFVSERVSVAENEPGSLRKTLDMLLPADVSVADEEGAPVPEVLYNHRRDGDEHIFFFANTSRARRVAATIGLRTTGGVSELLPEDGTQRDVGADLRGERLVIRTVLPPAGSRLFLVNTREPAAGGQPAALASRIVRTVPLHDHWHFRRAHPNSLVLDYCRYAVGDEPPRGPMPVWKVRRALRERFGLAKYDRYQPWAIRKKGVQVSERATVRLFFQFEVKELPMAAALVLEQAERCALRVNGHSVPTTSREWHWDKQFGKVDIVRQLTKGWNPVELEMEYGVDTEIEDIYLVGDFGVFQEGDSGFHVASEADHLFDGDWGPQGYPFYAGNMVYWRDVSLQPEEGKRYLLTLHEPRGTLFRIAVNGRRAVPLCWQPWQLDITEALRSGENRIEIEVCGSLRNTMGPLHHTDGDALPWVGPRQFEDESKWTDRYMFAPYGLVGGAEIAIS